MACDGRTAGKTKGFTLIISSFNDTKEVAMTTLARPGVPAGGFKTVGQVRATNNLVFTRKPNVMGIAVELLTTHTSAAPVIAGVGRLAGFGREFDVLRALQAKKNLNRLTAEDIMTKDR